MKPQRDNQIYQKFFLSDDNYHCFAIHTLGIDIWTLKQASPHCLFKEKDLSPEVVISKDKKFIFVLFGNKALYKMDAKKMIILKKINIPENAILVELLENGDLNIVIKNPNYKEEDAPLLLNSNMGTNTEINTIENNLYINTENLQTEQNII